MLRRARLASYESGIFSLRGKRVTPTQYDSTALSLTLLVPDAARDLAAELDEMLTMSGTPGMLKIVTALAASILVRDADLFRRLSVLANARGNHEAPARALSVAMHYAHTNPIEHRDALARLVTDAISRGTRVTPPQRGERIDPLLASCIDVVEIIHALSLARFTVSTREAPVSNGSSERRRVTRDFEAVSAPIPSHLSHEPTHQSTPVPPRSTMRPAPPRSTMRPSAKSNTLRPPAPTSDVKDDAILTPRTAVRDVQGRPLKKKW